jgi:ABC-2 type transport system permease protein
MGLRGSFLFQVSLMTMNDLIFFILWWIFFFAFQSVGNWELKDMAALLAICYGSLGLMHICFGGVKDLARIIISGGLDPFMTQPKNVLIHVAGSKSAPKGFGHLTTACLLIIFGGLLQLQTVSLIAISIVSGCLIFASIRIIAHSLAFWMGPIEHLSEQYVGSLFLFSMYPANIYTGPLEIVMYTLIPAGIIGTLPVELVRDFTWVKFLSYLLCTAAFCALAFFVFYKGLQRYESGNQFEARA